MANYKISIKPSAAREIEAPPKKDRLRIIERIRALAENPRPPGCEKLSGEEKYRVRQGDYRVLYAISDVDRTVFIIKVARRKDVYR